MPNADYYREQARRLREQGRTASAGEAHRWNEMAREYDLLAESVEAADRHRQQPPRAQTQAMQQQQKKLENDPTE